VVNDGNNAVLEKRIIKNKETKWMGLGSKYPLGLDNASECYPNGSEGLP
jgi:hypothetical protein